MRVLVCGSRLWTDAGTIEVFLIGCRPFARLVIIEGENPRGADAIAKRWALRHRNVGVTLEPYPAAWPPRGAPRWEVARAGRDRNQRMLDVGRPELVLAFKNDFRTKMDKGGTEDMVRRALAAGVPTYVIGE